jgi:hypothetical protein
MLPREYHAGCETGADGPGWQQMRDQERVRCVVGVSPLRGPKERDLCLFRDGVCGPVCICEFGSATSLLVRAHADKRC